MSKKDKILDFVVKQHWFEEIKSGRKNIRISAYKRELEYKNFGQEFKNSIIQKLLPVNIKHIDGLTVIPEKIRIRHGMRSDAEHVMLFKIKKILIVNGLHTDLKINDYIYEIQLGRRIK